MHPEHPADALVLLLDGVVDGRSGLHDAGVDAGEGEGPDEGVVGDLEGEGREGLGVGGVAEDLLVLVQGGSGDGVDVEGGGHVVDDGVEEGLDALVLEGRAGEDRDEGIVEGSLADEALEGGDVGLLPLEVGHEDVLVELDGGLDELLAPLGGLGLELVVDEGDVVAVGEGDAVEGGPEVLPAPDDGLHGDEVDDAEEVALGADGELQDGDRRPEHLDDGVDAEVEVGAGPVHLVEEAHAGDVVLVGLAPHGLGLRLDAGDAVEDGNGPVEDAEGPLDLQGEVDVAGSVDDVDPMVVPLARRGGARDGDAALLLLLHPVHRRAALVDLADLVRLAGVEQDALGRRRLAGVDVGHDADVAVQVEIDLALGGRRGRRLVDGLLLPGLDHRQGRAGAHDGRPVGAGHDVGEAVRGGAQRIASEARGGGERPGRGEGAREGGGAGKSLGNHLIIIIIVRGGI